MAVYRQKEVSFYVNRSVVVESIRQVLQTSPAYHGTLEGINNSFITNTQPHMLSLNTPINISVDEGRAEVTVTVSIKSQSFIRGDIFNQYNKFIDRFIADLRQEVESA